MSRPTFLPVFLAFMNGAAPVPLAAVAVAASGMMIGQASAQTVDERPASALSDEELNARVKASQALVQDRSTDGDLRRQLRDQMRADREELRRRQQQARQQQRQERKEQQTEQRQSETDAGQPKAGDDDGERRRRDRGEDRQRERRAQPAQESGDAPAGQQAAPEQTQQEAAPQTAGDDDGERQRRERGEDRQRQRRAQPAQEKSGDEPARQQAAPEQTERKAAPGTAGDDDGERRRRQRGEDQQRERRAQPGEEREQRTTTGDRQRQDRASRDADQRASRIIGDKRPADRLSDDDLRQRLESIRDLLGTGEVSDRFVGDLRAMLQNDREELRGRVSRQRAEEEGRRRDRDDDDRYRDDDRRRDRADRDRDRDRDGDRDRAEQRELRTLLRDDRPSRALSKSDLEARSAAARHALDAHDLQPRQRDQLRRMLQSDRQELRSRLHARREERRRDLQRRRQANELRIEIYPQAPYAPRDSIAAAEVDERALEQQLVAPPTRAIEEQYSFEEYVENPELREVMPGIELDTIRFGFNEYFVREEEIDELDRIGEIIERIVAANPDEVFVVEGHTDAVGSDAYNLELSRKRAQAVEQALLDYFIIEPENIRTVGYGERYLKIPTPEAEIENRRVTVRRITPILQGSR